ncbi:MAG: carboxypeptidase-like regulatory domain-containing protein [Bacteroidota bacterium]
MKTTQHTSKGISQPRQLEISKTIHQSFNNDIAKFTAFDPDLNASYSAQISLKISEVEGIPADYVLVAMQMQETQKVIKYSNAAISDVRTIRYYVEKAFPGDYLHLYEFGYPELKKVINTQSKLILFLKNFSVTLNKYKAELLQKGLSQTTFDEMIHLTTDLDTASVQQEQAKKARYIATGSRVKAYDELWKLTATIAKAGKLIFEEDAENQRNYILDVSPKKKTVKLAETEVNAAVFQGTVTDTETEEVIEDAIVEILGTTLSTTTDEDGEFYLDEVLPGTYSIIIKAVGYKDFQQSGIELASSNEEQEFTYSLEKIVVEGV